MKFKDWLSKAICAGDVCPQYIHKVQTAKSKKELMDIVLDVNGASFLLDMQNNSKELPYETITNEFKSYINGRYVSDGKYSGCVYCCYTGSEEIVAKTTLTLLLGCYSKVRIEENSFVQLFVDKNCQLEIIVPKSSRCNIEYCRGAMIGIVGNRDRVEMTERKACQKTT